MRSVWSAFSAVTQPIPPVTGMALIRRSPCGSWRLTGEQLGAFEKAGFLIQIKENGTDSYLIREGATVYTSITANDATVTAGEYGADYLVALSVKNVPVGSEIELVITPYLTDAGATKWAGTPVSAKVLASGAFDSEN